MKSKEFMFEAKRPKIKMPKPRDPNWQTMQAKATSGAGGQHKDEKRAAKQGDVKHKKDLIPAESIYYDKNKKTLREEIKVGDRVNFDHEMTAAPGRTTKKSGTVEKIEGDTVHVKTKNKYGVMRYKKKASELRKEETKKVNEISDKLKRSWRKSAVASLDDIASSAEDAHYIGDTKTRDKMVKKGNSRYNRTEKLKHLDLSPTKKTVDDDTNEVIAYSPGYGGRSSSGVRTGQRRKTTSMLSIMQDINRKEQEKEAAKNKEKEKKPGSQVSEDDGVAASPRLQRAHDEERKRRGLPHPDEYLRMIEKKKKEIADMRAQDLEDKKKGVSEGSYTTEKQILTRIRQIMYDRKVSGTESNAGELNKLKQQLKDMRSQQGVSEGSDNLSIGQQMARDGITYSPEKERELIKIMGEYMEKAGMSPKAIRYYLSHNEDFVSDQLEYLPRKGVSEGKISMNKKSRR